MSTRRDHEEASGKGQDKHLCPATGPTTPPSPICPSLSHLSLLLSLYFCIDVLLLMMQMLWAFMSSSQQLHRDEKTSANDLYDTAVAALGPTTHLVVYSNNVYDTIRVMTVASFCRSCYEVLVCSIC
jgi:hypothetical protein